MHSIRKRIYRSVLVSCGPNEECAIDDKMIDLGMPIYGIVDKFSGKILSMEIVLNNRLADVPALHFLRLCESVQGKLLLETISRYSTIKVFGCYIIHQVVQDKLQAIGVAKQ